eukprot:CAMPEP_0181338154 /NCGR_PEP_ID=MMETSP1101-20121128/28478_1 /TAXON_ID=46948 /ORGANISM="Rhodomonas abbreviata, Strain Caron Lab Isolate" /LENGTH=299 /DNA_ID=CAMNT_0023448851 /DNA_START=148 /DNA_END=1044 /DNA_ORIENTATION=+
MDKQCDSEGSQQMLTKQNHEEIRTLKWASKQPPTQAMILTSAEPPYVISHVNQEWTRLTGYSMSEAKGNTPKMLQGPNTSKVELAKLNLALHEKRETTVTLTNYNSKREAFQVNLTVIPLFKDATGSEVVQYMAVLACTSPDPAHGRARRFSEAGMKSRRWSLTGLEELNSSDLDLARGSNGPGLSDPRSTENRAIDELSASEDEESSRSKRASVWKRRLSVADDTGCIGAQGFLEIEKEKEANAKLKQAPYQIRRRSSFVVVGARELTRQDTDFGLSVDDTAAAPEEEDLLAGGGAFA